jgi:hypothetical protein
MLPSCGTPCARVVGRALFRTSWPTGAVRGGNVRGRGPCDSYRGGAFDGAQRRALGRSSWRSREQMTAVTCRFSPSCCQWPDLQSAYGAFTR